MIDVIEYIPVIQANIFKSVHIQNPNFLHGSGVKLCEEFRMSADDLAAKWDALRFSVQQSGGKRDLAFDAAQLTK